MAYPTKPTTEYKGPKANQPEWDAYNKAKAQAVADEHAAKHENRAFDTVSAKVVSGSGGGPTVTRSEGIRVPRGTDLDTLQDLVAYGVAPTSFSNEHGTLTRTKTEPKPGQISTATNTWTGPNPFAYTSTIYPRTFINDSKTGWGQPGGPMAGQELNLGNPEIEALINALADKG
jgi:hypothetical protein